LSICVVDAFKFNCTTSLLWATNIMIKGIGLEHISSAEKLSICRCSYWIDVSRRNCGKDILIGTTSSSDEYDISIYITRILCKCISWNVYWIVLSLVEV
jgi:hypothetical protein